MAFSILIFTLFKILFKIPLFPLSHKDASTYISEKVLRFAFHIWIFNPEICFLNVIRGSDCVMILRWRPAVSALYTECLSNTKFPSHVDLFLSSFPLVCLWFLCWHSLNYYDLITNLENWWDDCLPTFPWLFQVSLAMPRSLIFLVHFMINLSDSTENILSGVRLKLHWICRIGMGEN